MNAADEKEGPVDGKAQDIAGVVEIEGLCGAAWERPVEGGEDGSCVAQWGGAVEALNEAVIRISMATIKGKGGSVYLIGAA